MSAVILCDYCQGVMKFRRFLFFPVKCPVCKGHHKVTLQKDGDTYTYVPYTGDDLPEPMPHHPPGVHRT
jgi:phage FluMu protein Com